MPRAAGGLGGASVGQPTRLSLAAATTQRWPVGVVLALVWLVCLGALGPAAAQTGCSTIYPSTAGWAIDQCTTDPSVPATMEVVLNGVTQGLAALVRVCHDTDDGLAQPQVAILYASGFVRLKQNADPAPSIPFGTSVVLGPSYWPLGAAQEEYNPDLAQLAIDTTELPTGPLRLSAVGVNEDFDVAYQMALPPPRDRQTRLHVVQSYTANGAVTVDPARFAAAEGFKLVQLSSMFVDPDDTCDDGHTECHDSDAARYIAADGARRQVAFADLALPSLVFPSPPPLGTTWLDALHGDDASWQGNTPNVRVALDFLPAGAGRTVTPQGWIEPTTDPNDDNVGLWLHDDDPAVTGWSPGESGEVGYWIIAQDDPPDPWADLGLRPGLTFLDMEGSESCLFVRDVGQATSGSVAAIAGYADRALELDYDLGAANGNWAQLRCDFDPPLDLSAYDHLRFEWRGDPAAANSIEVALISRSDGAEHIFGRGFHHAAQRAWWERMVLPFRFLGPWTAGTELNPAAVTAFFVSVVKDPVADPGGAGSLAVDNVGAFDVANRALPAAFETGPTNAVAAARAAAWLASQQQPTGLLESWLEETSCIAHTYDQALALLVFLDAGMTSAADAVVTGLLAVQNGNGSWFKSNHCLSLAPVDATEWEGDIAWAIFALDRYVDLGGSLSALAAAARDAALGWLGTRLDPDDGCLVIDHTEGSIDAFWALATAGPALACRAAGVRDCLLRDYWDPVLGRIKGGRDWWQSYLDNQSWGSAMLRAVGRAADALAAQSYVPQTLTVTAQGGQLVGFDGQGGPWSLWNEGVGQYAAVGGAGAAELVEELLAQQRLDGAMPGAPDDFAGGGVWTSRWHGVAPTAWLYLALTGGPLPTAVPLAPEPFRIDLGEPVSGTLDLVACDSIFAGPGFHVEADGVVTLTAGRRIVVLPVSSVLGGGRLELATGPP